MKKRDFTFFLIILIIGLLIRCICLGSSFLWHDEVDIIATMFDTHREENILATSFFSATEGSSSPWLPLLILHGVIRLFGPHIYAVSIPSLMFFGIALFFLSLSFCRLFAGPAERWFPLFLLTISIPSIFYSRSPQPIICYFLSTTLQIYVLVRIMIMVRCDFSLRSAVRGVDIFAQVSLIAFLFNYMSILIYLLLMGYYIIWYPGARPGRFKLKEILSLIGEALVCFIPLAILTALRQFVLGAGKHRLIYQVEGPGDVFRLIYDFFTYHFNFAYSPELYKPLGINALSWPFILLTAGGIAYFLLRNRKHRLPAAVILAVFFASVYFKIMPFGGIRHSMTIAPFAYLFLAYGIQGLDNSLRHFKKGPLLFKTVLIALILYAVSIFIFSGSDFYIKRSSRFNLQEIIELARVHGVSKIAAFEHTYEVIRIIDYTAGDILNKNGLTMEGYDFDPMIFPDDDKYFLVAYRHAFNPEFDDAVAWPAAINNDPEEFKDVKVTALREIIGPLKPAPDVMIQQSIYYPINGFFVYLIEKNNRRREDYVD